MGMAIIQVFLIFARMKPIHSQITALAILLALLPGILGVGLVSHFCNTCQQSHKEAALLVLPHDHEDKSCACELSDNHETCHKDQDETHHHHHHCKVDIKRLDIPVISRQTKVIVPPLASLDISFETHPPYICSIIANYHETEIKNSSPPVLQHHKGTQHLSVFCVFRL
jgi:hypothetical protein